jgi:hypothetical protein
MAKVRKVDFSPDEFLSGIAGMTPAQGHVYWVICALIYSARGAIHESDERLFAIIKADPRTIRAAIAWLVSRGKVERQDDGDLMVRRCRDEIELASNRIRTAAENGSKGGRPVKTITQDQPDRKPEALSAEKLSPSPSPSTSPIDGASAPPVVNINPKAAVFNDCVQLLVQRTGRPREQIARIVGKWRKEHSDGTIIDVVGRMSSDISEPVSWITAALKARDGTRRAADGGPL